MNFKLNRSLQYFYGTVLLIAVTSIFIGTYYFWSFGSFDSSNVTATFEGNLMLEELKRREGVKEIKTLVESDRVRDAVVKMEQLEKNSKILEGTLKTTEFKDFSLELGRTKNSLEKLINLPELRAVTLVLGNKVSNLESFVIQNGWRTLTRISRRMKAKISPSRVRSPGFLNHKKLLKTYASLDSDIKSMEKVTINSVLSRGEKQQIITKLRTLETEMKMLNRYVSGLKNFSVSYEGLQNEYGAWVSKVSPAISLSRINLEKNNQNLVFSLLGLGLFLSLSFLFGFLFSKGNRKSIKKEMETMTLQSIKDGLLPFENELSIKVSPYFERELSRYRDYLHKRISFGSVFQEAVPFSSLLLDSNLNVVWANQLFYQEWKLEGRSKDNGLTWDFLQKFTNLGEEDPVLMALNQGISGIYQTQIRHQDEEEGLPYEMYISPVDYSNQKRVMIFLYPLRNLEETIQNQTRSIVGPISRTLDSLSMGQFNKDFQDKVKVDFDIAGIGEIFHKFLDYSDLINQQKTGLFNEIESFENKLYDEYKTIDDIKTMQESSRSESALVKEGLKVNRDAIVHNIDLRYELEEQFTNSIKIAKSILKEENTLLERSEKAGSIIQENVKAFESLNKSKNEFKQLKKQVDDFRTRLGQSLEQTLVFMKRDERDPDKRLEESLGRIKLEMKGVESVLSSFGEVVKNLDVGLSKVGLIIENTEVPNFADFQEKLDQARAELEECRFESEHLSRSGIRSDELVVESMKKVFDSFQVIQEKTEASLTLTQRDKEESDSDFSIEKEQVSAIQEIERKVDISPSV